MEPRGGGSTIDLSHTHTSASHNHSTGNHTLTLNEIPSHLHDGITWGGQRPFTYTGVSGSDPVFDLAGPGVYNTTQGYASTNHLLTAYSGGSGAHNHGNTGSTTPGNTGSSLSSTTSIMQPYIVMYIWRRSA